MAKQTRKPFEVKLSPEKLADLGDELTRDLEDAMGARSASLHDVTYWHTLYEQGRTRRSANAPWADAADLTSHIGTEKVDAMRARMVKTVMGVEPVFTVEGWGDAEKRAPLVEEFHQWQIEAEGFQQVFSRAIHLSLIEPWGVIEVYEDTIKRPVRKTIKAALQLAPDGSALVGPDFQPLLQMDPTTGRYVEVTDDMTPSAETEIDSYEVIARGPRHRTVAYRDFLVLPAHAKERADIWGYAKRFYRRIDELNERVKANFYDKAAVEELGGQEEHGSESTLAGEAIGVPSKNTERAEKELWELLILKDCGQGLRWYVATLHVPTRTLLRLQYDDLGKPRFFPLVPFPRPNSIEGYSVIGHKLITTIEEHTAWRNMDADRGAMQLQMPMKRKQGALWDPDESPIGVKSVIDVREMDEVQPMEMSDMTGSATERIMRCERTSERLVGITDVAAGVTSTERRTLGEVTETVAQSQVRMEEGIKNIQETMEELCQVRHLMWKRALAEMGEEGLEAPPSVMKALLLRGALPQSPMQQPPMQPPQPQAADLHQPMGLIGLETRAPDVSAQLPNLKFTASMMEGAFRFKPRGSVETADRNKLRADFNQSMQAISQLAMSNPMIAAVMNTPSATKALLEQWVRLYHVNDKQAFLGQEAMQAMQQAQQMQQMLQMMGGSPGMPGAPPSPGGAGSPAGATAGTPPGRPQQAAA